MRNYGVVIFLLMGILPLMSLSQNLEPQTSYFFGARNPVKIEVSKSDKFITFIAENSSFYPYQLEIEFTNFINLSPVMSTYKNVVNHGSTTLFRLTIIDINSSHDYQYYTKYKIGYANKKALVNYPYPIPLTEGKEIKLFSFTINNNSASYRNKFVMSSGDTILCMRKGIVTHIPSRNENQDRLLQNSSIEVLHEDGTVASYTIPGADNFLVFPGQNVYPLQPLVVLKQPGTLTIQMFDINNPTPNAIDFILEPGEEKEGIPSIKFVKHSTQDIERELTSKEMKKLAKGKLY